MTVDLRIDGGRIVRPTGIVSDAAIAIDCGEIVAVGTPSSLPTADEQVDASGKYVFPGIVDVHVHVGRDPFSSESWEDCSRAAAMSGVTTMLGFVFQNREGNDLATELDMQLGLAAEQSHIDYSAHAALTDMSVEPATPIASAIDDDINSFKMFMSTYDVGVTAGYIDRAFAAITDVDGVAVCHTEEPTVCTARRETAKAEGRGDMASYLETRPPFTEGAAADTALRMADYHDVRYFGFHTTCEPSVEELARFQTEGGRSVRSETCLEYVLNDTADAVANGNLSIGPPPNRSPEHIESVFDALKDEGICVISTDHGGRCHNEKAPGQPWWEAKEAGNHLHWFFPLVYEEFIQARDFLPVELARFLSYNPATTFGLENKGRISAGYDADLLVFDPKQSQIVDESVQAGIGDFSVYDGMEVGGTVTETVVRGEVVMRDGQIQNQPGDGRQASRIEPDWRV